MLKFSLKTITVGCVRGVEGAGGYDGGGGGGRGSISADLVMESGCWKKGDGCVVVLELLHNIRRSSGSEFS